MFFLWGQKQSFFLTLLFELYLTVFVSSKMDIVLADNAWKPFQLVGDSLRLAARVISNVGTLVTQGWPQGMTRHREKAGWLLGISPATVARVIGIANATNGTLEVEHPDRGRPLKKIQEMHIFKIKDYLRRRAMLGRWTGIKDLQHFLSRGGGWVPQEDEGEGPRGKPRATKAPPLAVSEQDTSEE